MTSKHIITAVLLVVVAVCIGVLGYYWASSDRNTSGSNLVLGNTAQCESESQNIAEITQAPFREVESERGAGIATTTGVVLLQQRTIWGERVEALYFVVPPSDTAFYQFFAERVRAGNTVNALEEDKLYFKLGIRENGTLQSTAIISPRAEVAILNGLTSGEPVSLVLTVPLYEGSDAPAHFSFACAVILASS